MAKRPKEQVKAELEAEAEAEGLDLEDYLKQKCDETGLSPVEYFRQRRIED